MTPSSSTCKDGGATARPIDPDNGVLMRWLSRSNATVDKTPPDLMARAAAVAVYDCTTAERISFAALEAGDVAGLPFHTFLSEFMSLIHHSAAGLELFHQASDQDYCVEWMNGEAADIDHETRTLYLPDYHLDPATLMKSPYFRLQLTLQLLRGLREIDQIERGVMCPSLRPDQALLFARAVAADATTIAIHIAHDLRHADPVLWRHVLSSRDGDLAMRYLQARERMAGNIDVALSVTFVAWYRDPFRVNAQDHETLEDLDVRLQGVTGGALMKADAVPAHYKMLCEAPLSDLTYLNHVALDALDSPETQQMNDDTNAAHLHHIMRDMQVLVVNNVAFRDKKLARLIFPDETPQ